MGTVLFGVRYEQNGVNLIFNKYYILNTIINQIATNVIQF